MKTKLETLKTAYAEKNFKKAIGIAAKFPDLGKERNAILDAHLAFTNPRWVTGLGKSVEACIESGVAALRSRYSL